MLDKDGIRVKEGVINHSIQLINTDKDEQVIIEEEKHYHVIIMDKGGFKLSDGLSGHAFLMKKDSFVITAKKALTIDASGQSVVIKSKTIDFQKG